MSALENRRHELFAQGLVEGKTTDRAYVDAGYKQNRCNASRLNTNENIRARVAELQAEHRKRHNITIDDLCDELDESRELALETAQPGAAAAATMGKARLLGLGKGGAQPENVAPKTAALSDIELARRIASLFESGCSELSET
jgi:hypothetical protein